MLEQKVGRSDARYIPAESRITISPPGCSSTHVETSSTFPPTMIHTSFGELCFATSSVVYAGKSATSFPILRSRYLRDPVIAVSTIQTRNCKPSPTVFRRVSVKENELMLGRGALLAIYHSRTYTLPDGNIDYHTGAKKTSEKHCTDTVACLRNSKSVSGNPMGCSFLPCPFIEGLLKIAVVTADMLPYLCTMYVIPGQRARAGFHAAASLPPGPPDKWSLSLFHDLRDSFENGSPHSTNCT